MNELSTIYEQFIVPLSPFLWLSGVALLLICLEIVLNESHSKVKLAIAGLGALGGLVRCLDLYHQYPLTYNSGAGVGGRWLVAFAESFEVSPLTLKLSAGICFITLIALFLVYDHFKKQDYLGETLAILLLISSGMLVVIACKSLLLFFVALEMISLPTYILVGVQRQRKESCEAALKYFIYGSVASVVVLMGIALIYAQVQSFHLPTIAQHLTQASALQALSSKLLIVGASCVLVGSLFKMGTAPFHMWVPDVYQGATPAITGYMGSAIKIAIVAFILQAFSFLPKTDVLLYAIGAVGILWGSISAVLQKDLKRLFAYSSVAHAGFLVLGIAVLGGDNKLIKELVFFYLVNYGLLFIGAFAVIGMVEAAVGKTEIEDLSGLGYSKPWVAIAFSILIFSLAGLPPTAGFTAKYFLLQQTASAGQMWLVILALLSSAIGLYYYLRLIVVMYQEKNTAKFTGTGRATSISLALAVAGAIVLSIIPGFFLY